MWKTKSGGGLKEWEDAGTGGRRLEVNRKHKLSMERVGKDEK
jgi:hypothetical protein